MSFKKIAALLIGVLALYAVVTQYYIMYNNRITSTLEATIRFFSYFTILTNSLVAVFFIALFYVRSDAKIKLALFNEKSLVAVTVYILIVCLIYQFVLRSLWKPEGLSKLVDELLHTIIPICTCLYWWVYGRTNVIAFKAIFKWLMYPFVYLVYILIRGYFSDFYPYPFMDVSSLGYSTVLMNSVLIFLLFTGLMVLLIYINNFKLNNQKMM